MRLVKNALFIALSVFVAAPLVTSSFVVAAEATKAMDAKDAQAQEITGKAKLPKKGDLKTVKDANEKAHCEKCHDKGEKECKACHDKSKSGKKDMKADCKDCPDCKSGKKNCETCDHCQRKKHDHAEKEAAPAAVKDAAPAVSPKAQ